MKKFCEKCKKTMEENQFYSSNNLEKHPDGKMNKCKKCATMHINNWDPETFLPVLEDADVPYVKEEWNKMLDKYCQNPEKVTGLTVIGRYLSKMKLTQYSKSRYADSDKLNEESKQRIEAAIKDVEMSEEERQALINSDFGPAPEGYQTAAQKKEDSTHPVNPADIAEETTEEDAEILKELTTDDIKYLSLKWGKTYKPSEWVKLEKLYQDMIQSYDIQTAGHLDTLKLVCKVSLKANQLLDVGDIDAANKASAMYDKLMKSGNFTAAQNKSENGDDIDSVSEFAYLCEKEGGFIPTFYQGKPNDCVDKTLEDLKRYTYNLVTKEQGLGDLIEAALKTMKQESEKEDLEEDETSIEEEILEDVNNHEDFSEEETQEMSEEDYLEFKALKGEI